MRVGLTVIIILLCCALIRWCLNDTGIHPVKLLPFLSGHPVGLYDIALLGMAIFLVVRVCHLLSQRRK
ncbi:MAG: hypothetical protein H6819_02310 [Phycisphaerales bacterium]|nr:hypothetical protein [Phycisphaerales bacterium]MCB9856954.1 hypothetical protein [Phycisphaerales bacterium]MCB9861919.1 hypothetical protein [Phycisphaerales bacterium]